AVAPPRDRQRRGPAKVERLELAVEVLQAGLEANRAAVHARARSAAERVVAQQVLRESRHARVAPSYALGDRVPFGLLAHRHPEEAVGPALHAELGQEYRQLRRQRARPGGEI